MSKEVLDLLNSRFKKEEYKLEPHSFVPLKHVGKQYCRKCGLVALNNEFTQWSIRMGCNSTDHPQFESTRHRLTKPEWVS